MKILIGSEHAGYDLKNYLVNALKKDEVDVTDNGVYTNEPSDYPFIAERVCNAVVSGDYKFGVLICGTGIGMSITANKVIGIRAALCSDLYTAKMTREHNDANILCLAARVIANEYAHEIVKVFLDAEFAGGRHIARLDKLYIVEHRGVGKASG
jgi:ribose 5-phosphate isomerase B